MSITIEVANDNPFNTGWLEYVLGLPEPSVEDSPDEHDGWMMGKDSGASLMHLRAVFSRALDDGQPMFNVVVNTAPVVNVTVDDQNAVVAKPTRKVITVE